MHHNMFGKYNILTFLCYSAIDTYVPNIRLANGGYLSIDAIIQRNGMRRLSQSMHIGTGTNSHAF